MRKWLRRRWIGTLRMCSASGSTTVSRARKSPPEPGYGRRTESCSSRKPSTTAENSFCNGTSRKPMIELDQVSKRYGSKLALDNLSLHVQAGELFAFLGPNGAGKTTTIKLM